MTTVQITLSDELAEEAAREGLLASERIESMLREQLRAQRITRMKAARNKLAADPLPSMTAEKIQAEIEAYRAERRAAGP